MSNEEQAPLARILVVEDQAIIAFDLKRRLERMGYEVIGIADSGKDALALALEGQPDLILMDIIIYGPLDGIETAQSILKQRDIPIVFLTAHSDPQTLERAKTLAPYGYIVKPFEERDLNTTVDLALRRHATEASSRVFDTAIHSLATGFAVLQRIDTCIHLVKANPSLSFTLGQPIEQAPLTIAQLIEQNPFLESDVHWTEGWSGIIQYYGHTLTARTIPVPTPTERESRCLLMLDLLME